jgi:uncharacterized Zn-binding protein involved in type VI secretion
VRRPLVPLVVAVATTVGLSACNPDTVRVSFRPKAGAMYTYRVHIRSTTTIRLGDQPASHDEDEADLRSVHKVESVGADGAQVAVQLSRRGSQPREFVVRFDRAAQLAEVVSIEGLPASALGDIGLSEIFPAAAGAPPNRPLRPGAEWRVDDKIRIPGGDESRLTGSGRLLELRVVDGRKVASVRSHTQLPVSGTTAARQGTLALEGTQVTDSKATHAIADGAVERASSVTRGTFHVVLQPPPGKQGPPVEGVLTVEVHSDVQRVTRS